MSITIGQPAPDFTLQNQDRENWSLADQRGRKVVLLWYPLDWSPTCENENCKVGVEMPLADAETVVVGISRDSTWSHKAWKNSKSIEHDLLADPMLDATRLYGLQHPAVPFISHRATVIIDREGRVAWMQIQEATGQERDWDAVQSALKQVP